MSVTSKDLLGEIAWIPRPRSTRCAGSDSKRSVTCSPIIRDGTKTGASLPDFRAKKATSRSVFAAK